MYKILIVEDEYLSANVLELIISKEFKEKVEIIKVDNGLTAKHTINEREIDLAIIDINIPIINGTELCKYIRIKKNDMPIVVITGDCSYNLAETLFELEVNDYFIKPVREEIIIKTINKYMDKDNQELPKDKNSFLDCLETDSGEEVYDKELNNLNDYTQEAIQYVEKNIKKNITLEEVAKNINITPHYLSKIFKKEVGINFVTYVTDRKIDLAKEILADKNIPIVNISISLAFNQPNYFSKVFKKKVGVTPSEYREQCIKNKMHLRM